MSFPIWVNVYAIVHAFGGEKQIDSLDYNQSNTVKIRLQSKPNRKKNVNNLAPLKTVKEKTKEMESTYDFTSNGITSAIPYRKRSNQWRLIYDRSGKDEYR